VLERFRGFCREQGVELCGAAVMDIGCGKGVYAALRRDEGVRAYLGVDITDVLSPRLRFDFPAYGFLRGDVTSDHLSDAFADARRAARTGCYTWRGLVSSFALEQEPDYGG
jgi:SAM-dependent methyltransferase